MAITKVSLTIKDIEALKNEKKSRSNSRIWISIISILILSIVYLCVGFDTSSDVFRFFAVVIIVINGSLFLWLLIDSNFDNDLSEKQKYVGIVKVKKKKYWQDNENNSETFIINFDEWRIGNKAFKEEYWKKINEGDEFYVEQAANSGFVLKLKRENEDFKIGII